MGLGQLYHAKRAQQRSMLFTYKAPNMVDTAMSDVVCESLVKDATVALLYY